MKIKLTPTQRAELPGFLQGLPDADNEPEDDAIRMELADRIEASPSIELSDNEAEILAGDVALFEDIAAGNDSQEWGGICRSMGSLVRKLTPAAQP